MSDLIERLRAQRDHADDWRTSLSEEAADEIERLRGLLREARFCAEYMASGMTHAPWMTEEAKKRLARIDAALADQPRPLDELHRLDQEIHAVQPSGGAITGTGE